MGNLELTALEETIMLALVKPRYGQEITEVVSEASNGRCQLSPGTLYPALKRLERRKLIQGRKVQDNLTIRNGHSRRYYQVTEPGKIILDEMESMRTHIRKYTDEDPQVSF